MTHSSVFLSIPDPTENSKGDKGAKKDTKPSLLAPIDQNDLHPQIVLGAVNPDIVPVYPDNLSGIIRLCQIFLTQLFSPS